ncbi:MAG: Amino acid/amide transporter ATP-binding protein 2, family [Frankiales bacterium]|nr:Amino acid/amide transporter ATP-binding protein 2, family [Frankiales bacterium]
MSLLEVSGLTAGYGSHAAIHDVAARAERGEVTALVGHNGAGKTTLLNSIAGVLRNVRGSVVFDGVETLRGGSRRRPSGLAMVPQGMGVFPSLTVGENVTLGVTAGGKVSKEEAAERIKVAQGYLPLLAERWNERGGRLSGGQRQMVSIGRALVSGASCILLDEPSVGLSPKLVEDMMKVFATLRDAGLAIVLVEQNVKQALTIADRVVVMKAGRVIVDSSAEEFSSRESLWELF